MTNPQSTQHGDKLVRIVEVFTELPSIRVRLSHLRSSIAFHGKQRGTQGNQHVYFALETLRCF
jgi:hypothetical protein